jgi:hypothetical protein
MTDALGSRGPLQESHRRSGGGASNDRHGSWMWPERGRPMRIPHEFRAYGKTWRVQWWHDPDRGFPGFNPRLHHSYIDSGTRVITMHPNLKGRPRRAFEAFVHEVMHIVNWEERKRSGRSKYRLPHELIYHLDEPLAFALMGMGVSFRCVCPRCASPRSHVPKSHGIGRAVFSSRHSTSLAVSAAKRARNERQVRELQEH